MADAYTMKVEAAYKFAGDRSHEGWAGQFLMGLAIAGLELLPWSTDIRPKPHWKDAPEPPHNGNDWAPSWIVEYGALNKVGDSYGDD